MLSLKASATSEGLGHSLWRQVEELVEKETVHGMIYLRNAAPVKNPLYHIPQNGQSAKNSITFVFCCRVYYICDIIKYKQ